MAKTIRAKPTKTKPPLDGNSPLKSAAVSVLLEKPGKGYAVAQRIMRVMGPAFIFEEKHIYPVLTGLVRNGLAVMDGQKIYYPTDITETAWREWLLSPAELTVVREDIQVRLAFAQEKDAPELLRVLTEYQRTLLAVIGENVIKAPATSWTGRKVRWIRAGVDQRLNAEHQWVTSVCNELREFIADRRWG